MLKRLYARVLRLASSRHAPWWLAAIAFAESSFFPIPPDVLLVPMSLARPQRAWRFAAICTLSSVAGGVLGYVIGFALFDVLATPLLRAYHAQAAFERFRAGFAQYGFWVIMLKGVTPIPFKIVTIASGAARFNFGLFLLACLLTRGARFMIMAPLLHRHGDRVRVFIDRRLGWVAIGVCASVVGGFALLFAL